MKTDARLLYPSKMLKNCQTRCDVYDNQVNARYPSPVGAGILSLCLTTVAKLPTVVLMNTV